MVRLNRSTIDTKQKSEIRNQKSEMAKILNSDNINKYAVGVENFDGIFCLRNKNTIHAKSNIVEGVGEGDHQNAGQGKR